MDRVPRAAVSLVAWSVCVAQVGAASATCHGDDPPALAAGDRVSGAIADEAAGVHVVETETLRTHYAGQATVGRRYRLEVAKTGPYTLDLRSWQFDAYLVLRDETGAVLAEDDDGFGVGVHARLVPTLEAGRTYEIEACALHGMRGDYELTLTAGAPAPRTAQELARARDDDEAAMLAAIERRFGARSPEMATALHGLATRAYGRGEVRAARPHYADVLAIREHQHGRDHPEVISALTELAAIHLLLGEPHEARSLGERALPAAERVLGPHHEETARVLLTLGSAIRRLGDLERAQALLQRALTIREAQSGPDHPDTAECLHELASLQFQRGDLAGARGAYARALAIHEATLGPTHLFTIWTLSNLAAVLGRQGDFEGARQRFGRALATLESTFGPDHPHTAGVLNDFGSILLTEGALEEARGHLQRAVAIRERELGPDRLETATSRSELARVMFMLGDLAGARPLWERVLATRERVLGLDHPDVATVLNNLAQLLFSLGDVSEARRLTERALAINEARLGETHPETAAVLNNLAGMLASEGDLAAAVARLEHVLEIREVALGPDHPDVAMTLNGLATMQSRRGDLEAAEATSRRALAIYEASPGGRGVNVARTLVNLGIVLYRRGDFESARPLLERGLATAEAILGPSHADTLTYRGVLAFLLLDLGDDRAARRLLAESLELGRVTFVRTVATLTEGEALLYLARFAWLAELLVALSHGESSSAEARESDYAAILGWKGRVGRLTTTTRGEALRGLGGDAHALVERLRTLQRRLAHAAVGTDGPQRERGALDRLLEERADLERRLRRVADTEGVATRIDVERLREALPPRSAVVDLYVHRVRVPARRVDGVVVETRIWEAERVSAWIVRPDEAGVGLVDLGPAAAIEDAVAAWRAAHVEVQDKSAPDTGAASSADATVSDLLWRPLAPRLEGVDTVFVSPEGVTAAMPFEVLRDAQGRYLVEGRRFVYGDDVVGLLARLEDDEVSARLDDLLVLGDVDYARDDDEGAAAARSAGDPWRGSFTTTWRPLPATRYESRVVADLHARRFPDGQCLLLRGVDATESRLRDAMGEHHVLHVATHGFFQPEGLRSMWAAAREATREGAVPVLSEAETRLAGMHPGLLSGLVLAGANVRAGGRDPTDDGYLTAEELGWLDLDHIELVVLSACETGLGLAAAGEGLMGLRRAFHLSGAAAVISSLWSVEDDATADLMRSFYEHLLTDGMGRHQALRAAQLDMLARNRARYGDGRPATWGPFVLSGEWR